MRSVALGETEALGARLRQLRQERGLTLADLAGGELSIGLISKIERGKVTPSLGTLRYLASRLDVRLAELLADRAASDADAVDGVLDGARTSLLLGDPASAAASCAAALAALETVPEPPHLLLVRFCALLAETHLVAGNLPAAAAALGRGSKALARLRAHTAAAPARGQAERRAGHSLAESELAWVLGSVERRRGRLGDAERAWLRCLDTLESAGASSLEANWQRARVLAEHGSLSGSLGAAETARNFLLQAQAALEGIANPAQVAQALVAGGEKVGPSVALAIVAAAARLREQVQHELGRLERAAASSGVPAVVAEISHSRHLR
jgi:transcriptional regulator with XRE-family HTH domain